MNFPSAKQQAVPLDQVRIRDGQAAFYPVNCWTRPREGSRLGHYRIKVIEMFPSIRAPRTSMATYLALPWRSTCNGTFGKSNLWLSATTHAITKKQSACDNDVFGSQRGLTKCGSELRFAMLLFLQPSSVRCPPIAAL